ncbi:MAG: aspartate-semialdehyde dehydrogenase [Bacilli bacterium]|nr:aspartate-semialdehyde dehydrogenase [Bacilli bacterium]HHU24923.1 aspartate-semialdehyde dehydrogenase [Acholeplasmataceae bacterium]
MKKYNVVVVGATGLVGRTLLKVLEERNIPINNLRLIASEKSIGKKITVLGKEHVVEGLSKNSFINADFVFFCAGSKVSKQYIKEASKQAIVIDNSSAFRMNPEIPLVVPWINGSEIKEKRIIANANCSIIPCITVLKPLNERYHITKVNYTTYQSVSGSGFKGINDLMRTRTIEKPLFYPQPIALTCIPFIGEAISHNETSEEQKMKDETKKILNRFDLKVSATCIRVPVFYCHGIVVSVEAKKEFDLAEVKKILSQMPKVILKDDLTINEFPSSVEGYNTDYIYVGRIRLDETRENGLILYILADNLRTGAASSSVEIMQYIINHSGAES